MIKAQAQTSSRQCYVVYIYIYLKLYIMNYGPSIQYDNFYNGFIEIKFVYHNIHSFKSIQFRDFQHIHSNVQPSLLCSSECQPPKNSLPVSNHSSFPLLPPSPTLGNSQSAVSRFAYPGPFTRMDSYNVWPFMTVFFPLRNVFKIHSCYQYYC